MEEIDAGYVDGATRVLSVREMKAPSTSRMRETGWRATLPAGWEALRDIPGFELEPGAELIEGLGPSSAPPAYRWDGAKFLAVR